jgi:predicted flap endonuclease-1-like 5' DNA nuclease
VAEATGQDYDGDGVVEGVNEGTRPATMNAPKDGKADDLKKIKGVGPKLEALLNRLGFFHFEQVASWSDDEVAWVDANLEGFKGRVSRDNWVEQASVLARGGETEFSKKVEDGDVY